MRLAPRSRAGAPEPAPVSGHQVGITFPSGVDPGVRAHHEALRMLAEKRRPAGREPALGHEVPTIGELPPERRVLAQQLVHAFQRRVEPRVRPDDPRLGVVREEDLQGLLVAVGVEDEPLGDGEVDDVLHDLGGGVPAEDVELADAAVEAASLLGDDHLVDLRVVEPGAVVVAGAVDPDERHDPGALPRPCGLVQRAGAIVGAAVGEDRLDAVPAEELPHLVDGVTPDRVVVVMQVRVEDGARPRFGRGGERAGEQAGSEEETKHGRARIPGREPMEHG